MIKSKEELDNWALESRQDNPSSPKELKVTRVQLVKPYYDRSHVKLRWEEANQPHALTTWRVSGELPKACHFSGVSKAARGFMLLKPLWFAASILSSHHPL